jgi:hypothetical protein
MMTELTGIKIRLLVDDYLATRLHDLDGSKEEGYSVSYSSLWAPAIDAMQKLDDRTQDHETRISALEEKIE